MSNDSQEKLLQDWRRRVRESQHAHFSTAKRYSKWNYIIGIPNVIIISILSVNVSTEMSWPSETIIAFLGLLAAVLAALQTFLKFPELSEKHKNIGSKYGSVRRELESILANTATDKSDIDHIKEKIDYISDGAPHVTDSIWNAVENLLKDRQDPLNSNGKFEKKQK